MLNLEYNSFQYMIVYVAVLQVSACLLRTVS